MQTYKLREQLLAGQSTLANIEQAFKRVEARDKDITRREELLSKHLKKLGMTEKELDISDTEF